MHERELRMTALETVCYVAGAGAFSVFIRWLQTMLAYNEEGLVDASVFNFLVPAIVAAAALLFRGFVNIFKSHNLSLLLSSNSILSFIIGFCNIQNDYFIGIISIVLFSR